MKGQYRDSVERILAKNPEVAELIRDSEALRVEARTFGRMGPAQFEKLHQQADDLLEHYSKTMDYLESQGE